MNEPRSSARGREVEEGYEHQKCSQFTVRGFGEGDAAALTSLFNSYYRNYAGFSKRTVEHWMWCCLGKPDVGTEGILVATEGDDIVGYTAIGRPSSAGDTFHVYELCYDKKRNSRRIVSGLLQEMLHYADEKDGTAVSFDAPTDDSIIREVCLQLGFSRRWSQRSTYAVVVIDMPNLLAKIAANRVKNPASSSLKFAIKLTDLPPPNCFLVRSDGAQISVPAEGRLPYLTVETDTETMARIVFGSDSTIGAILGGRVKIRPLWASLRGIAILLKLRLKLPWFIPKTDHI